MSAATTATIARSRAARSRRSPLIELLAAVVAVALLLASSLAFADEWKPPALRGHVVDEAAALSPIESQLLDRKLDRVRKDTGFAVVIYLMPRLPAGLSIEDVGYKSGNAWGVGSKGADDGVLILAALEERRLRIETGRGVGGTLTDLQASRINREVIGPLLRQGRVYEAMSRGTDAVLKELAANTPDGKSESAGAKGSTNGTGISDVVKGGIFVLVGLGVLVLLIVSPTFREIFFWILFLGRFSGGGRRGGGGSNYRGGGGSFGGGGSSDNY